MSEDTSEEESHVETEDDPQGIEIPPDKLSEDALIGVIDEFITREGTDYGHQETTADAKRGQVRAQLQDGDALLLFDPKTETINIILKRDR
ncbi:MAG: YheU family protein [Polyangiales bacterium]